MSIECMQSPQQTHKRECLFKIIVIGDMSTGKTSLIQSYVRGVINQHYKPTLGVDFATKLIQFDDTLVRIQFWDISGQERFANMTRVYYRDSHGAIIVYDCKRSETYKGAFRWKKDLDSKLMLENGNPIPSILVANKCDLDNDVSDRILTDQAALSGFQGAFKISAKTGDHVEAALNFLIRRILDAERNGLYMMPVFQRDHDLRRLSINEDNPKKRASMSQSSENCASITPLLISAALGIFLFLFLVIYSIIFRSDIAYYFKGRRDRKRRKHRGGGTETTVRSTVGTVTSTYNGTTATTYNPPKKTMKHKKKRGRR